MARRVSWERGPGAFKRICLWVEDMMAVAQGWLVQLVKLGALLLLLAGIVFGGGMIYKTMYGAGDLTSVNVKTPVKPHGSGWSGKGYMPRPTSSPSSGRR